MLVPLQIVTPKDNKPIISIVQDSLLAASLFSKRDTFLTRLQGAPSRCAVVLLW